MTRFCWWGDVVLIACLSEADNSRGPALRRHIKAVFDEAFGGDFDAWVRQRLAVACGDGAMVAGGPSSKHNPNQVFIADLRGRPPRALWDVFHPLDKAGVCAFYESNMETELFDMLKQCSSCCFCDSCICE